MTNNIDEIEEAWNIFTKYAIAIAGPLVECNICFKKLVTEEVGMHLRRYHHREAADTLKMILNRNQLTV